MKLLIVAGHGNGDPGACALGYREADLTREVAKGLYDELRKTMGKQVDLYDTSRNLYSDLKSGKYNVIDGYTDIIEIHFNACVQDLKGNGKSTGTEILVHKSRYDAKDIKLEERLLREICDCGLKNRGVKPRSDLQNMNICRNSGVNYFLIEMCFIDDLDDMNIYKQFKRWNIEVFADTLLDYWGYSVDSENESKPVTVNTGRYDSIDSVPYGKDTIQKLVNKGLLKGGNDGKLNLSEDMLRVFIVNDRAGLYD